MASGFPWRDDLRGTLRFGIESTGGLLKRSLTAEQEAQNTLFVRSVKQKNHLESPTSSASAPFRGQGNLKPSSWSFPAAGSEKKSAITHRLLQLERQLLDDEDDELSASDGSAVANSEWSETMQKLISSQKPPSNSPTSSSSSSSSSSSVSSRQMLLDTAIAISAGNLDTAATNISVLKGAANKLGNPEQRLTAMMVTALALRVNSRAPAPLAVTSDIFTAEHLTSSQMLYEASPCFKLALMAANLAILEATKDHTKIHIVDFDVGQGLQLASLLHSLAERRCHLSVKITAFCDPTFPFSSLAGNLSLVGDRLAKLAGGLGIELKFNIVNRRTTGGTRTTELDRAALDCEAEETLAVNFAFLLSRIADESVSPANPRDELLRRVKALRPKVVTLVEQEMNGNTAPFATRFAEACAHYGALLESMEAIIAGRESNERARVEACLSRKACNSVAREGVDRVERCEVYGKWKARLGMAGFKPVQLGPGVVETVKFRLALYGNNPGFMVKEEDGRVGCGWMGRVITVASAWH